MALTFYANADGTRTPHLPKSKPPPPQHEFSLTDLEPFQPEPFTEETSRKTLQEIVLEEVCFDFIKSKTLEVLEDPPGGNDELWDLLRKLVLDSDANGNPRFTP